MACAYVLWSERLKKRYVGCSRYSASQRLLQHNEGHNRFTKGGVPWVLLYSEEPLIFRRHVSERIF